MKNIHIIPTNKPSRLCIDNSCNELNYSEIEGLNSKHITNQNIYITDNSEIREGDWFIDLELSDVKQCTDVYKNGLPISNNRVYPDLSNIKKIILATDQDLLKDGVQAIDDEFLEWFVKNPSCEVVEIEKTFVTNSGLGYQEYAVLDSNFKVIEINTKIPQTSYYLGKVTILNSYEYVISYKIIIPQEEPKCTCIEHDPYCCQIHGGCPLCVKPETLEDTVLGHKTSLIAQMLDSKEIPEEPKQTYSEKQVKAAFNAGFNIGYGCQVSDIARKESICEEWFKQFKK
jgi:hypothetical protein